ncbi:MAG: NifU family protein [Armatimonadota bacterium]
MSTEQQVKEALEEVRPMLQRDGGDVEFVDVDDDGQVSVRLQGHCKGCPMAQMTLTNVIERILKDRVDTVQGVIAVD